MANISKGERKQTGIRMPVALLEAVKREAQTKGLGLNDYLVLLIRLGRRALPEAGHSSSQTQQRTA